MPQINLISPNIHKKIKKTKTLGLSPVDLLTVWQSILVSILPLLVVLAILSLSLLIFTGKKSADLSKIDKKEESLVIDPQELIRLNNHKTALNNKINLLKELSSQGFSWAGKLLEISDSLPSGVWLTEVALYKTNIDPGKNKSEKKDSELKMLVITGNAIAPQIDNAVTFVGEFVNSLKQNKSFAQDFSEIKLRAISKSVIGKSDVMNFVIECILP